MPFTRVWCREREKTDWQEPHPVNLLAYIHRPPALPIAPALADVAEAHEFERALKKQKQAPPASPISAHDIAEAAVYTHHNTAQVAGG